MKKIVKLAEKIYLSTPAMLLLALVLGGFVINCFVSNTFLLDNRPLAKKPTKFSADFPRQYEQYFNETFSGRKKLVKKFSKIKLRLGMDSGYIINGLNGWMFYDSAKVPDGYTLIDYYGEIVYTPQELDQMTSGMKAARDFYAKKGIDYMIVVTPNKESLYSEYMPERMQRARVSDLSRNDRAILYAQENSDVAILNLSDSLKAAKPHTQYPLYFQKDTHWNNIGAYVAYIQLAQTLQKFGYNVKAPAYSDNMVENAMVSKTDLSYAGDKDIDYQVKYKEDIVPQNLVNEDHGFFQVWENKTAPVQKRVLMLRDSQGIALMRYIEKDFAFGVFAHIKWNTKEGLQKLVETYKPDLVIDELGERYFDRFLKYNDIYGDK